MNINRALADNKVLMKSRAFMQPRNTCALGIQQMAAAIPGVIPIVHSGSACCLRLYKGMNFSNGCQGMGYGGGNAVPNDNIHRADLIYGAEKTLRELIAGTLQIMKADLYVVLTGCNVELAGDDARAVVAEFRKKGMPIILAETAGFKGSVYQGYEWVIKAMAEQFLAKKGAMVERKRVNLWVSVPYADPFWSGNQQVLKEMLERIGLKVNLLFGPGADINNWRRIPEAQLNLLISPWAGAEGMEILQERFGTPFLHYPVLPIGASESRKFLSKVAEAVGLNMPAVNSYIRQEEEHFYYYLERAAELFTYYNGTFPDRFFSISESLYVLGITRFLCNDLGLLPGGQFITDDPPRKYKKTLANQFNLSSKLDDFQVTFVENPADIQAGIEAQSAGMRPLILGSSWDKEMAGRLGGYFLEISAPLSGRLVLDRSYAGYRGGLRLAEDIYSAILSEAC